MENQGTERQGVARSLSLFSKQGILECLDRGVADGADKTLCGWNAPVTLGLWLGEGHGGRSGHGQGSSSTSGVFQVSGCPCRHLSPLILGKAEVSHYRS